MFEKIVLDMPETVLISSDDKKTICKTDYCIQQTFYLVAILLSKFVTTFYYYLKYW